ncbi:hypothetical protein [Candidatus Poriferisodalis sp.]|uniref:hypothetical protein n=1 Tax=Candidatus Poriferisodalis sp. TaxID=3101277 RepID=UPI003B010A10
MPLNLDFSGMTEEEIDSYCEAHADEICAYAHSLDPNHTTPMTTAEQELWRCALRAANDGQRVCDLVEEARRTGSSPERIAKLLRLPVDEVQALYSSTG